MPIYVKTSQNVLINFEISNIGKRVIAALIDHVIMLGLIIVFAIVGALAQSTIMVFLGFTSVFFYNFICELTMNGQSVGKRNQDIRVMKKDGSAASFSSYFLRFLLRPIDSFYGLGLGVMFLNNYNQRLGDLAAGTIVVNLKHDNSIKNKFKTDLNFDPNLNVLFPEVVQLNDTDIHIITSVLHNRVGNKKHPNIKELAFKIASKLQIISYDETKSYSFLRRIVQDYYKSNSVV